ncbi:hypothetical protein MIMGU_mgv1a0014242mg, partial [Erythranthe guttata]
MQKFRLYETQS